MMDFRDVNHVPSLPIEQDSYQTPLDTPCWIEGNKVDLNFKGIG